ncbi:MAG: twin-arginine translocation signal domain-containing protein [Acidiferrobacterales bacterium]
MNASRVNRRRFLKHLGGLSGAVVLSRHAWAARLSAPGPRLIVLFLRGAIDGLNVVVPYADPAYYDHRP